MQTVALIGRRGALAKTLLQILQPTYTVTLFGRPQLDFNNSSSVIDAAQQLVNFDYIINCAGILHGAPEEIFAVNALGPILLLSHLNALQCRSKVIMIGSHSATWRSWPGIELSRLCYNTSKKTLEDFVKGFSHGRISTMDLCVCNPSRFESAMSNYSGAPAMDVAEQIKTIMSFRSLPLVLEMESPDARTTARN